MEVAIGDDVQLSWTCIWLVRCARLRVQHARLPHKQLRELERSIEVSIFDRGADAREALLAILLSWRHARKHDQRQRHEDREGSDSHMSPVHEHECRGAYKNGQ